MPDGDHAVTAVAIADILNQDLDLVDQVEGMLLVAGASGEMIAPAKVAREVGVGRESAANLFRQLDTAGVATRTSYDTAVVESHYKIRRDSLRKLFSITRQAISAISAYLDRQPARTEIEPLVTFPEDPAFDDITPATFGMKQLLSALASEIKQTEDSIILVAPFFEGTGFERLQEVLADALERGVDLTIITRYLTDKTSHNREVIETFVEYLDSERGFANQVQTVDYTVWDDNIPANDRKQDGAKPAFTLHAKMMLFDEFATYVGSANITDYGFDQYLELGVLLRGPYASRYRDLCEFLLASSGTTTVNCD